MSLAMAQMSSRPWNSSATLDEFHDPPVGRAPLLPPASVLAGTARGLLDGAVLPGDDQAGVHALLARQAARAAARRARARPAYRIRVPLDARPWGGAGAADGLDGEALAAAVARGQAHAVAHTVDMTLRQVYRGRKLSELALDVDTLRFQSFADEVQGRTVEGAEDGAEADAADGVAVGAAVPSWGSVQVLQNGALLRLDSAFDGVVVSSVARGGLAWTAGIRADHVLATALVNTIPSRL